MQCLHLQVNAVFSHENGTFTQVKVFVRDSETFCKARILLWFYICDISSHITLNEQLNAQVRLSTL